MYYLYLVGKLIAYFLPRKACYSFAKFVATLQFYIARGDRSIVINNLTNIVEDKTKVKVYAREVFINFAYYLVDFYRYSRLNHNFIKKYVRINGLDHLKNSLSKGKGVVALSAHLGNYELAGAIISLLGHPVSVIALVHKDKRVNAFFDGQRQRVGMNVIPTGVAIKKCFSTLKRGQIIGLLGDKDFSGSGVKLKMGSGCAIFPRGAAFFSLRTGADIIPTFLIREDKFFYRLIFEEPIAIAVNSDEESVMKIYIEVLEKYIRKYPRQWYMFSKYWVLEN